MQRNCESDVSAMLFSHSKRAALDKSDQIFTELTAISGLSARTYSWGGEGGRFFFAGDDVGVALKPCLK